MKKQTKVFPDPSAVAVAFARDLATWINTQPQKKISIALSGGSTPKLLFSLWSSDETPKVDWNRVHFFWGDERCVPPDHGDSNYGVVKQLFFDPMDILQANIHRVLGENDPVEERARYEHEIKSHVEVDDNGIPKFDLVILGMGADGHTASIFPHESELLHSSRFVEVATHPQSGQKRLTLTGPVINRANKVVFLITGSDKAAVLTQVLHETGHYESFPASHIHASDLCFYVDQAALNS
jgi:6-phosphogluconolactonase